MTQARQTAAYARCAQTGRRRRRVGVDMGSFLSDRAQEESRHALRGLGVSP